MDNQLKGGEKIAFDSSVTVSFGKGRGAEIINVDVAINQPVDAINVQLNKPSDEERLKRMEGLLNDRNPSALQASIVSNIISIMEGRMKRKYCE